MARPRRCPPWRGNGKGASRELAPFPLSGPYRCQADGLTITLAELFVVSGSKARAAP
jgi:hypothetical protein